MVAIGVRPATDFLVGSGLEMTDDGEQHPAARPARTGGRPRVGRGGLLRGAPPDRRPVGVPPPRHPRRQARPGARRQPGRRRPVVRRDGRHVDHPLRLGWGPPRDRAHGPVPRRRGGRRARPGGPGHRRHDRRRLHARGRADRHLGDGRPRDATAPRRAGRRRARRRSGSTPRPPCCGRAARSTTSPGWTCPTPRRSPPPGRCCRSRRDGWPSASDERLPGAGCRAGGPGLRWSAAHRTETSPTAPRRTL